MVFEHAEIQGLVIDGRTDMPVVMLMLPSRGKVFGLRIGIFEANAIAMALEKVVTPRPMTHDLLKNVIQALGGAVTQIVLSSFRENTFYATVIIRLRGEDIAVDARPSDAFTLALRFEVPILVAPWVVENYPMADDAATWFALMSAGDA